MSTFAVFFVFSSLSPHQLHAFAFRRFSSREPKAFYDLRPEGRKCAQIFSKSIQRSAPEPLRLTGILSPGAAMGCSLWDSLQGHEPYQRSTHRTAASFPSHLLLGQATRATRKLHRFTSSNSLRVSNPQEFCKLYLLALVSHPRQATACLFRVTRRLSATF